MDNIIMTNNNYYSMNECINVRQFIEKIKIELINRNYIFTDEEKIEIITNRANQFIDKLIIYFKKSNVNIDNMDEIIHEINTYFDNGTEKYLKIRFVLGFEYIVQIIHDNYNMHYTINYRRNLLNSIKKTHKKIMRNFCKKTLLSSILNLPHYYDKLDEYLTSLCYYHGNFDIKNFMRLDLSKIQNMLTDEYNHEINESLCMYDKLCMCIMK